MHETKYIRNGLRQQRQMTLPLLNVGLGFIIVLIYLFVHIIVFNINAELNIAFHLTDQLKKRRKKVHDRRRTVSVDGRSVGRRLVTNYILQSQVIPQSSLKVETPPPPPFDQTIPMPVVKSPI